MKTSNLIEIMVIGGMLLLAAYLRLHHVGHNPGWYTDEGTHLNIAHNILQNKTQYLAVDRSTLLFARLPLFEYLLAGAMDVFGEDITTLRRFTGFLGVVSTLSLYATVRLTQTDRLLAGLAGLAFAIYPPAVLYSRFGFSYNLLTPLVILAGLGLVKYWQTDRRIWLLLTVAVIGIGLTSDLMIGSLLPVIFLIVLARHPMDLTWSLPALSLPFGLYAGIMLLQAPDAFLFDLDYTLFRLNNTSWIEQVENIGNNYTILLTQDYWFLMGIIGLFLIRSIHLRFISLIFLFGSIAVLGRTVALYHLSFYYLISLLTIIALGIASLTRYGMPYTAAVIQESWRQLTGNISTIIRATTYIIAGLLILTPIGLSTHHLHHHVRTRFPTTIAPFLIEPEHAYAVADYINANSMSTTTVIATPTVAWLLEPDTADFQMSVAFQGISTVHMPGDIDPERFVFDPRYTQADYVIIDNLWRNWGVIHMPEVAAMLRDVETWPLVFLAGQLQIHKNPANA